jgi:hypothetical protein
MNHIDLKECSLFLIDGTGANYVAIRIGEGNFSYSRRRNIEVRKSRGNLNSSRETEEEPTDIQFQFVWDTMVSSGSEPPTIEEIIDGTAPGWAPATSDPEAPFTVNIQIVRSLTCQAPVGPDGEVYNFPEFNCLELSHSLKDSTVDCKGFSNRVKPHITRGVS